LGLLDLRHRLVTPLELAARQVVATDQRGDRARYRGLSVHRLPSQRVSPRPPSMAFPGSRGTLRVSIPFLLCPYRVTLGRWTTLSPRSMLPPRRRPLAGSGPPTSPRSGRG